MKSILTAAAATAALLFPVAEAFAQIATYKVRAGAGAQLRPDYPGADGHELAPLFTLGIKKGEDPFDFGARDDSFGFTLFSLGDVSIGPAINIEGGREESDVDAPVGEVPTTVEAGAFAQHFVTPSVRLRGEVRKGIGGHQGLVASLGADHVWRDEDRYLFSIGPRLLFSDARYQREYFGVSPEASLASGLPVHRPDGGIYGVAAMSSLHYQLSGPWGLFGFARYERLMGDAADSPIVRDLGSRDQLSGGIGITHTFNIRL